MATGKRQPKKRSGNRARSGTQAEAEPRKSRASAQGGATPPAAKPKSKPSSDVRGEAPKAGAGAGAKRAGKTAAPAPGRPSGREEGAEPKKVEAEVDTRSEESDGEALVPQPALPFPVVGIGASAGGLEALQEFFAHLPADSGCAFVVVTHMHREHTSMLPELLAKCTTIPVVEAVNGQRIAPDHVYVAPPGDNLTIRGGMLQRRELQSDVRLPIDHFLRALAADQHENGICVILSGTGTDGTLGLRAIKGEGGMAMVQKPQSAKFAGMPSSAESTGQADYLLLPADMPSQLVAYVVSWGAAGRAPVRRGHEFPPDSLHQILGTLRMRTGNDFSAYKPSTIRRRIERRMHVHRIQTPYEYARYLRENKHEANLLFRELLITVTSFFRDPAAYSALCECMLEEIRRRQEGQVYRVWVPGCATGEEAYSVAIALRECMEKLEHTLDVQVFATDLDPGAIEAARSGLYTSGIAADVSQARLARYFTREHDGYRISKETREMVVFAAQNLISDPPFTRLDLIVCRNLLIYFDTKLQKQVLPTFHYALRPGGVLFLGPSETIGTLDGLFEAIDRKWKIYRRKETGVSIHAPQMTYPQLGPTAAASEETAAEVERSGARGPRPEQHFQQLILERFAPTCLVVDDSGNIAYIHGRTGMFLELGAGRPSHNVVAMARGGLGPSLASALRRAGQHGVEVKRHGIPVKTNGGQVLADLVVTPIERPDALRGLLLVTLMPAGDQPERKSEARRRSPRRAHVDLEEELRRNQESLQSTVEELESANEELKSANEELQSMNEELHSANEELETSKEEMQSLNEELSTVNTELNSKIEDLSRVNDDMQNLLNGIDVATIFLDDKLRIKRYTEQARELIHLVPGDVGRPLADLALHVEHPGLIEDCRLVLRTLARREERVPAADGGWLMMRILPYRTSSNLIDGVVVTFVPIDELERAEARIRDACHFANDVVQTVREPLIVLDSDHTITAANRGFHEAFGFDADGVEGRAIRDLDEGKWCPAEVFQLLEELRTGAAPSGEVEVEREFPRIGRRRLRFSARRSVCASDANSQILIAIGDVTKEPA